MPHVFPRRFLRRRDLLDPKDMNEDLFPAHDLLSGRLDRTNFVANNIKKNLRPHPDSRKSGSSPRGVLIRDLDEESSGGCVGEGAYYKIHHSSIESYCRFYRVYTELPGGYHTFPTIKPPNFVELDGVTFRDDQAPPVSSVPTDMGSTKGDPFVIPNTGAWSAVGNETNTGTQKLTFETGESKIWISAYLQYIWQGFYEYKSPYIPGSRKYRNLDGFRFPDEGGAYDRLSGTTNFNLAFHEARVLNALGPSEEHEALPTEDTENTQENVNTYEAHYAFPLNEKTIAEERRSPSRCGSHHISEGFFPCLVQFALRVDGKIIEETITGKKFPFEESTHGLQVTDSIRLTEEDELAAEAEKIRDVLPMFTPENTVFGQRSATVSSAYGDSDDCRPGQKLRSSRAVSMGPEVMPVRIGAVVSVQPGQHTIEIVARRLERKKSGFKAGDFVGVFSRRLLAFDLPLSTKRIPIVEGASNDALKSGASPVVDMHSFQTEDIFSSKRLRNNREILQQTINDIQDENIDDNVFDYRFLPSKVTYTDTVTIEPALMVHPRTGEYEDVIDESFSNAVFAGFRNPRRDSIIMDNITTARPTDGCTSRTGPSSWFNNDHTGWYPLKTRHDHDPLRLVANSAATLAMFPEANIIRPGEIVLCMMDVELRRIEPIYHEDTVSVQSGVDVSSSDGDKVRREWSDFGNWFLAERYLDLFALFAIGVKKDGSYIIATEALPAIVNSFNWVNRGPFFNSSNRQGIPFNRRLSEGLDPWDIDPGWQHMTEAERRKLFSVSEVVMPSANENKQGKNKAPVYERGMNLFSSNLGVNVPIMRVIENTTSSTFTIDEYCGFVCSILPSTWMNGNGPGNPRHIDLTVGGTANLPGQWISPKSRQILKGARVYFGNSTLSVTKMWK